MNRYINKWASKFLLMNKTSAWYAGTFLVNIKLQKNGICKNVIKKIKYKTIYWSTSACEKIKNGSSFSYTSVASNGF